MVLDDALRYADQGWRVFPCHSAKDGACSCGYACSSPAKHPRTSDGLKSATTDKDQITKWWTQWPDANVAIATGEGLTVLDVDERHDGYESLREFAEFPPTPAVVTGGGGLHYYFKGDARTTVGIRPGLDVRGNGGYVLAPPSVHISGRKYEWELGSETAVIAPIPIDVAGALVAPRPSQELSGNGPVIGTGARNATLASIAGSMRRRGSSSEVILAALLMENQERCKPPLPDREVHAIAASVSRYAPEPSAQIEVMAKSATEFLAMDIPAPRFLVEGICPEHAIIICGGAPKSFKSYLMLNMAFAVATGKPFIGQYEVPAPRTVLLIDHEGSLGAFRVRVNMAKEQFGDAPSLYLIKNRAFNLEDAVDVDRLRLEISSIRPDLTILDPLSSFIRGDENSAQQMGVVVRTLRGFRDEFGTAFAVVHHTNKGGDGQTTRGGDRLRGSSALYAAAEGLIWVRRVDAEEPRSDIRVELKDGDAPAPFQVFFDSVRGLHYIDYAMPEINFREPYYART